MDLSTSRIPLQDGVVEAAIDALPALAMVLVFTGARVTLMSPLLLLVASTIGLALASAGPADARPARCETTDDGAYSCDFARLDRDGGFRISAVGKPTYTVLVDEPGLAQASVSLGGRNVPLPGPYRRDRGQPGCWVSDATRAKICAR